MSKANSITRRPLLLGHRGALRYAPENTFEAFDLAVAHRCDGFEFDVRITADGQAVVCHDADFCGRSIAGSSYDLLAAGGAELPRLQDILSRYCRHAFLYIELKVPGLEALVVDLLRQSNPEHGFVVASFFPNILSTIHALDSFLPLGLIARRSNDLNCWRELPVDFVMPHRSRMSRDLVRSLHEAGKRVLVWTVNTQREMLAMGEAGVDGILSDDTMLLGRTFGREESRPNSA